MNHHAFISNTSFVCTSTYIYTPLTCSFPPSLCFQVILNYLGRGMDLLTAVTTPRVHTQLLPQKVEIEHQTLPLIPARQIIMPTHTMQYLQTVGGQRNATWRDGSFAVTQFVVVDPDTQVRTAVSDPRKGGRPAAQQP